MSFGNMNKETAGKNLAIVREQIGLLESCIGHASSNRSAFDGTYGQNYFEKYESILSDLRKEEWDYQDILRYSRE